MGIYNLDRIFQPKTVAVVGASEKPDSIGTAVMENLINGGFKGEIYPVHPHYSQISNRKAYRSVKKLPAPPDLIIIATPIRAVPEIIKACAEIDAGGAVIVSVGGKEVGSAGAAIENKIRQALADKKLRVFGPNCLGIVRSKARLNASLARQMPLPGKIAFISQSGPISSSILDYSVKARIGFSYFVSLGAMVDVDFGDMIDYMGGDPDVSSIVIYAENLVRHRNFMSAARAVSRIKPIIVLKAGRTEAGIAAAATHTGALATEDAIYDAAFKRAGIVRVKTFEELFDCAEFLDKQPRPAGAGLSILSNAGGPGVMAVDALAGYSMEPVKLQPETIRQLDDILPADWSHANPVDILGTATPEIYKKAINILFKASEVNGLLVMWAPHPASDPSEVARAMTKLPAHRHLPVFTCWLGGDLVEEARDIFTQAGISTFNTPERAVRAFMDLCQYARHIEMLKEIPATLPARLRFDRHQAKAVVESGLKRKNGILTEVESKALLAAYGVPVNPTVGATDEPSAIAAARNIGFPVAVKIDSADVSHKSNAGGVVLNIQTEAEVTEAFRRIIKNVDGCQASAAIRGVTVQPMLHRPAYELILGVKRDRYFGPVLMFGMGGIYAEVLKDRALGLPPLNRLLARRIMEGTRVFEILKGYRNDAPANIEAIEEILIRLSQLVTDFSEIKDIDINPLIVDNGMPVAADARIVIQPSAVTAPLHLIISPYPNQYESQVDLPDVGNLVIRPIRPEDAKLLQELFDSLSARSVYYRFFSPMKKLSSEMLARFTQIDYDREIALVAIREMAGREEMLGVGRVMPEYDPRHAEFSIVVADAWHKKGIGAELLRRCLDIARDQTIERVWGLVLGDNTHMLALGRKLGFSMKMIPQANAYELSLQFTASAENASVLKQSG